MYQIGDLIIYGGTGVCRVSNIAPLSGRDADAGKLYYVLDPLYQDGLIYTPAENGKVFTRPVITKRDANRLIDMIPTIRAEAFHSPVLRQLTEHYDASLKTHDCGELLELTMSIYAKKQDIERQKKKFGAIDQRFMRRAEELLYGELAVALGIPYEAVPDHISKRVAALTGRRDSESAAE